MRTCPVESSVGGSPKAKFHRVKERGMRNSNLAFELYIQSAIRNDKTDCLGDALIGQRQ